WIILSAETAHPNRRLFYSIATLVKRAVEFSIIGRANHMEDTQLATNDTKNMIPCLHNPRQERRCTAQSKQRGGRCRLYAVRGKTVCRFHGGLSTGPKAPAVKHGNDTLDALKERMFRRLKAQAEDERLVLQFFVGWIEIRLESMDYAEFRRVRSAISAFVSGNSSAQKVTEVIDGKVYHRKVR
ncbi:MAG: HGGxSTG domain-containing protein, partial [Anaerohalosphaeraceae bacterium]